MNSNYIILSFLLIGLLTTGCGLYVPLSESVIYDKEIKKTNNFEWGYRAAISGTKSFYSANFTKRYRIEHPSEFAPELNPVWQSGFTYYGLLFKLGKDLYIGITPGLIYNAGADFTYQIYDKFYITTIGNLWGNFESIIQSKIVDESNFKTSLGLSYRHETQGLVVNLFDRNNIRFPVNMVGVRGLVSFELLQTGFVGILGLSYELKYKTPIIHMGISFVFDN